MTLWMVPSLFFTLIAIWQLMEYGRMKKNFNRMVAVQGTLHEYQLGARQQRLNRFDPVDDDRDLSVITTQPKVRYEYTFNDQRHHAARLSLLDVAGFDLLNTLTGPKPKPVTVYVDPDNPQSATLCLGRYSLTRLLTPHVLLAVLYTLSIKVI